MSFLRHLFRREQLPPSWGELYAQRTEGPATLTLEGVTLTLEEARHCQRALGFLATNHLFDAAFGQSFVRAAETFSKITLALADPGASENTAWLVAEADRAAAEIADNRSQLQ